MKIVIDACSVILLAKSSVLEKLVTWRKVVITKSVYKEVMEGKDKKLLDALLLERLVEEKKMSMETNIKKELVQKCTNDFSLGLGEAESVAVALENKDIVLTDNKQGRKAAKVHGLQLIGSIEIVVALYKTKKIDKEKAIHALKVLRNVGWFQDYIIEEALVEVKNG